MRIFLFFLAMTLVFSHPMNPKDRINKCVVSLETQTASLTLSNQVAQVTTTTPGCENSFTANFICENEFCQVAVNFINESDEKSTSDIRARFDRLLSVGPKNSSNFNYNNYNNNNLLSEQQQEQQEQQEEQEEQNVINFTDFTWSAVSCTCDDIAVSNESSTCNGTITCINSGTFYDITVKFIFAVSVAKQNPTNEYIIIPASVKFDVEINGANSESQYYLGLAGGLVTKEHIDREEEKRKTFGKTQSRGIDIGGRGSDSSLGDLLWVPMHTSLAEDSLNQSDFILEKDDSVLSLGPGKLGEVVNNGVVFIFGAQGNSNVYWDPEIYSNDKTIKTTTTTTSSSSSPIVTSCLFIVFLITLLF